MARDATGCIVYGGSGEMTALIGVEDLVVVHSQGVTLVCPKERAEEVRELVRELEQRRPDVL